MSRCFPFPPPGYAGRCSSQEALILSIKLQREKEKAVSDREREKFISEKDKSKSLDKKKDKEGRKKGKRDREEKKDKKDKEERRKEKKAKASLESGKTRGFDDKLLSKTENVLVESKGKLHGNHVELLEMSSVTEEHGQPIDSQNAPCSSDSTGNSGKRKRSLPSPSGIQSNGNIIRIRLSTSQKRDEPSTSRSKDQEVGAVPQTREDFVTSYSQVWPCVGLARQESSIKQKNVISDNQGLPCVASTSTATLQLVRSYVSGLKEETGEPVSQHEKPSFHEKIQSSEKLSSHYKRMKKKESVYKKLFVDWVPPPLEKRLVVDENDDEDWLFGKKDEDRTPKRSRISDSFQSCGDNLPCSASAAMQPRAHFLANAEIYALPFTVPF